MNKFGPPSSVIAFCCSTLLFSAAIPEWLGSSELSSQLWPDDINATVVKSLGGTVERNAVGEASVSLGTFAVWMRLLFVSIAFFAVGWLFGGRRGRQQTKQVIASAFITSSVIVVVSVSWWLLWIAGSLWLPSLTHLCATILPLWLMCTLAAFATTWCCIGTAPEESDVPRAGFGAGVRPVALLCACTLAWIAVSYWMNYRLYCQLLIPHGDSAMYEEHLWNIWHGKGFRSYLDQGLFLGEHIQVIHLLILPLHMLWPSHLLLELVESIALGSCVWPIYLIARRYTNSRWAAAFLGVAWLFYFPMHFLDIAIDQKTFRPIALGIPFLFWMIEFAERRSFGKSFVCLLLVLSAKEDMTLVTFPLLAVLAYRAVRETEEPADDGWKWLAAMSVFSLGYLFAVVLFVIPMFRSGDHVHYARYFGELGGTPSELIKTALTDPLRVIQQAVSVRTLFYVGAFLAPVAFFPVRKPLLLLGGAFTFGMLSLLEFGGPGDAGLPPVPYHHFHAPLLPVLFWAAAVSIGGSGRLSGQVDGRAGINVEARAVLILFCCVATSATGSLMPCSLSFWSEDSHFGISQAYLPKDEAGQRRAKGVAELVKQIPLSSRVASTDYVHTRLTHCERSYDYSGYLRKVNDYQPGVPADTDYIVIDTGHRYSAIRNVESIPELKGDDPDWELVSSVAGGEFLVLKRKSDR